MTTARHTYITMVTPVKQLVPIFTEVWMDTLFTCNHKPHEFGNKEFIVISYEGDTEPLSGAKLLDFRSSKVELLILTGAQIRMFKKLSPLSLSSQRVT